MPKKKEGGGAFWPLKGLKWEHNEHRRSPDRYQYDVHPSSTFGDTKGPMPKARSLPRAEKSPKKLQHPPSKIDKSQNAQLGTFWTENTLFP